MSTTFFASAWSPVIREAPMTVAKKKDERKREILMCYRGFNKVYLLFAHSGPFHTQRIVETHFTGQGSIELVMAPVMSDDILALIFTGN